MVFPFFSELNAQFLPDRYTSFILTLSVIYYL